MVDVGDWREPDSNSVNHLWEALRKGALAMAEKPEVGGQDEGQTDDGWKGLSQIHVKNQI